MNILKFITCPIQVNTYLAYDETKELWIQAATARC